MWIPTDAEDWPYDNNVSGLTADNVQDALDELAAGGGGGGGGGAWTLLDEVTRASAGFIEFTGIPATYKALCVEGRVKGSGTSEFNVGFGLQAGDASFDTGASSYAYLVERYDTASGYATSKSAGNNHAECGYISPDHASSANRFGVVRLWIPGYADTSAYRQILTHTGHYAGNTTPRSIVGRAISEWLNTADPISRLRFGQPISGVMQNLAVGSNLRLWGVG